MKATMKNFIRILTLVLAIIAADASAQFRVLAGQSTRQTVVEAQQLWTEGVSADGCHTTGFTPTRIVNPAPSAPPRLGEVFRFVPCYGQGTLGVPTRALPGDFVSRSANDVGTFTVTCTGLRDNFKNCVPWPADWPDCGSSLICGSTTGWPQTPATRTFFFEVYNNAPTARITHTGPGVLAGTTVAHNANVTLSSGGADANGPVTVTWRITSRPMTATAVLSASTGANTTIQFTGERDFGLWTFVADVDDQQGERYTTPPYTLEVVNQTPRPEIRVALGGQRVRVGSTIDLLATSDEDGGDYTRVVWEMLRPRSGTWEATTPTSVNPRHLLLPTSGRAQVGIWRFRVRVTDNEMPPLTGQSAEFEVEVYNELPVVAAAGPSRIRVGQPFTLTTPMLSDPDGGPVTVRWIVIQAPTPASVALGVPLPGIPGATHPGTWVFRARAEDDEGGTTDSTRVAVVVDANPVARLEGTASMTVRAPFDLRDISWDPDSECPSTAAMSDPHGCHSVAPGEAFTPLSGGLTRWTWYVDSVPAGFELFHPPGRINETFPSVGPVPGRVLHINEGEIPFGNYRLRVEVEDAEGNPSSASVQLRILPPMVPPMAHISVPQRYMVDATHHLLTPVILDGTQSFDLDNALSELRLPLPTEGITSFAWLATPPPGCAMSPAINTTPAWELFAAGTVLADTCLGVWTAALVVTDDDSPRLTDVRVQDFVIGRCAGEVCIDRPTHERPNLIDGSQPVDVPIYYYVEPSLAARYPGGYYGVIDVLPTGSSTPVATLYDTDISTRPAGTLNVMHWHGNRTTAPFGIAPAGAYDVRVRIADTNFLFAAESDTAVQAILYEQVEVTIADTSTRYSRHEDLQAGVNFPGFEWTIDGANSLDAVRMVIKRVGVGVALDSQTATTLRHDTFRWDGRTSTGSLLAPGDYEVRISALRDSRILATSDAWRFTVYKLELGPTTPGALSLGINNDDDNRNSIADGTELNVTGEDDLVALAVRIEPSTLDGTVEVFAADGGTGVAIFMGRTKTSAATTVSTPGAAPNNFHVEGRTAGLSAVDLRFTPRVGAAFPEVRRQLHVTGIELLSAAGTPATALLPGLWEAGVIGLGDDVSVNNDPGATFVDTDPARFVVRVTDPGANLDPATAERVSASIGTLVKWPLASGDTERWADPLTVVELLETGPNTGVFESESQLLTVNDELLTEFDDEFQTWSAFSSGVVADEGVGDRTHRLGSPGMSFIRGGVRAQYGMMMPTSQTVPVCGRGPDVRRSVMVRPRALMEPFQDDDGDGVFTFTDTNGDGVHQTGEVSEPYVDLSTGGVTMMAGGPMSAATMRSGRGPAASQERFDELLRAASQAWSRSCIEIRATGPMTSIDDPALIGPTGFLHDGHLKVETERVAMFSLMNSAPYGLMPDVIDVVFGATLIDVGSGGFYAYTDAPAYTSWTTGPAFIFMSTQRYPNTRILAHELGHAMTNADDDDETNPPSHFYPAGVTRTDDNYRYRHYPSSTATDVRTVRPTPTSRGNGYLHPF